MIKRLLFGSALLLVGVACLANQPSRAWWQSVAQVSVGGAAAFTGPADIYTDATICYSMRACSAALRGTNAVEVCNTTGAVEVACVNYVSDATTGDIVVTTIGGLTCAGLGALCTVKTFYNQIGGTPCASSNACNLSNGNVTERPQFVVSCIGGKPCARCVGAASNSLASATNLSTINATYTISDVSNRTSGTSTADVFNVGGTEVYYAGANLKGLYAGSVATAAQTDGSWNATQSVVNSTAASSTMYINGSSSSVNPGNTAAGGQAIKICGGTFLTGDVTEGVISPSDQTSNRSAMDSNQRAYYGF